MHPSAEKRDQVCDIGSSFEVAVGPVERRFPNTWMHGDCERVISFLHNSVSMPRIVSLAKNVRATASGIRDHISNALVRKRELTEPSEVRDRELFDRIRLEAERDVSRRMPT